eukprot:jgi/Tetstr1/438231/TSEL_002883.t1
MDGAALLPAFKLNHFKFAEPSLAGDVASAALAAGYLDPSEVSDEYEAFMFSRAKVADTVTKDLVAAFKTHLRKHQRLPGKENAEAAFKTNMESLAAVITPTKTPGRPSKRKSSIDAGSFKTPAPASGGGPSPLSASKTPGGAAALLTATPASAFRARTQGGKVQAQLNPELEAVPGSAQAGALKVEPIGEGLSEDARYIGDTLKSKAMFVESRILGFMAAVEAAGGPSATFPVSAPSQEPVYVAGRITCDSDGKLNEQSAMLEGSMQHSGGASVKLDLSKVPSYSLFPGQVVLVEGTNPTGRCLTATSIVSAVPAAATPTEPRQVSPHSVVAACGPFSTSENLAYEPLQELLEYCTREAPGLLLLMAPSWTWSTPPSPLASSTSPSTTSTPHRCVTTWRPSCSGAIARRAWCWCRRSATCTTTRPSPPFRAAIPQSGAFDPPGAVSCLPNPASWTAGGVAYGACTTDVLRHLSAADIRKGAQDRVAQLASYALDQGSFYPLYPPAPGVNLDASLASEHLAMPSRLDILLAPSDLGPCAKAVRPAGGQAAAVVVNPGRLAKGAGGGSFAHLHVHAPKEGGAMADSVRVDIIRV